MGNKVFLVDALSSFSLDLSLISILSLTLPAFKQKDPRKTSVVKKRLKEVHKNDCIDTKEKVDVDNYTTRRIDNQGHVELDSYRFMYECE